MAEVKVSEMTLLSSVPDDAKIYIVKPGDTTEYYTTKAAFIEGIQKVLQLNNTITDGTKQIWEKTTGTTTRKLEVSEFGISLISTNSADSSENREYTMYLGGFYVNGVLLDSLVTQGLNSRVLIPAIADDTDETMAFQSYVDSEISDAVSGLLDDRGNYDASTNLFPTTGGSGISGVILKGDLWTISVAGILGGVPVTVGDVVRALVDSPGTTSSNWVITENNIGYVPENSTNKSTSTGDSGSSVKFPVWSVLVSYITGLGYQTLVNVNSLLATFKTTNFLDATSSIQTQIDSKLAIPTYIDYSASSTIGGVSSATAQIDVLDFATHMIVTFDISAISNGSPFTFTVPYIAGKKASVNTFFLQNGSTAQAQSGGAVIDAGSDIVVLWRTNATSSWTNAGTKRSVGQIVIFK